MHCFDCSLTDWGRTSKDEHGKPKAIEIASELALCWIVLLYCKVYRLFTMLTLVSCLLESARKSLGRVLDDLCKRGSGYQR